MKQKFNIITSTCIPLPLENVDTDQIIPARFLKATDKKGMGENLFRDWRYNADGSLKTDFVLNDPSYSGVILVADIHKNNEINNFVLPVVVSESFLQELFDSIAKDHKTEVEVNLPEQTVTNKATGHSEKFEINGYKKHCLMNGLDDIDYLLQNKDKIVAWEEENK